MNQNDFLALMYFCQFNFQTQPGTPGEWRKNFSSPKLKETKKLSVIGVSEDFWLFCFVFSLKKLELCSCNS